MHSHRLWRDRIPLGLSIGAVRQAGKSCIFSVKAVKRLLRHALQRNQKDALAPAILIAVAIVECEIPRVASVLDEQLALRRVLSDLEVRF